MTAKRIVFFILFLFTIILLSNCASNKYSKKKGRKKKCGGCPAFSQIDRGNNTLYIFNA